jgi:hypothetical protein
VIDQNPLGYLLGLEGIALMRIFAAGRSRAFTERRLAELHTLLDLGSAIARCSVCPQQTIIVR